MLRAGIVSIDDLEESCFSLSITRQRYATTAERIKVRCGV